MKKFCCLIVSLLLISCIIQSSLTTVYATKIEFYEENIIYGDIDNDGRVTLSDVTYLQRATANLCILNTNQNCAGDLDCDNQCSLKDVVIIQKLIAKLISLSPEFKSKNIVIGKGESCSVAIVDDLGYNSKIRYTSSNPNVINVDSNGKITGVGVGSCVIFSVNLLGKTSSLNVTVKEEPIKFTLNHSRFNLKPGDSLDLNSYVNKGAAAYVRKYLTSDQSIASVNNYGIVKAKKEGTVKITCKIYNGLTASCNITIKKIPDRIRTNLNPNKPMVALTFDDGPNYSSTSLILDTLEKYNARATFFVVGCNLYGNNAKSMKRAYEMGCEIGNHTYSHQYFCNISATTAKAEINGCSKAIYNVIGCYPTVFRLPGGISVSSYLQYTKAPVINWSVDTRDWESLNSNSVYNIAMSQSGDGDIVLMHDLYMSTAYASQRIITDLVNNGYQLVTISELAYYKGYNLNNGSIYYKLN
ncbi:MAG: polysaccharide deacetylase family protein [Clostridia bacterium]|nr:polysaccharide deacetylase family protein [Clostridia bacterium]